MRQTEASLEELVRDVVHQFADERGPLLLVLHEIQSRHGHVPSAAVPLVAQALNLSRADVHGVLSFYRDFDTQPRGTSVVRVCRAEACAAVGANDLVSSLEQDLGISVGSTAPDGTVTLDQVFCLGNCALGPSVEVDGRLYGRADCDRVTALIAGSHA